MISTNQKRKSIRVGTNLVAKVSANNSNKIVYVKDVSAIGAQIESRENFANVGDIMNIEFKYKNVLYDLICKVIRIDGHSNNYGVKFYFKNESDETRVNTNCNKSKLYNDILEEYFLYTECFI